MFPGFNQRQFSKIVAGDKTSNQKKLKQKWETKHGRRCVVPKYHSYKGFWHVHLHYDNAPSLWYNLACKAIIWRQRRLYCYTYLALCGYFQNLKIPYLVFVSSSKRHYTHPLVSATDVYHVPWRLPEIYS